MLNILSREELTELAGTRVAEHVVSIAQRELFGVPGCCDSSWPTIFKYFLMNKAMESDVPISEKTLECYQSHLVKK